MVLPTIGTDPKMPLLRSCRCIEPPSPRAQPLSFP